MSKKSALKRFIDYLMRLRQSAHGYDELVTKHDDDIRLAELDARIQSFLGADYDRKKRETLLSLQAQLNAGQRELEDSYKAGSISGSDYVLNVNTLLHDTMLQFEEVLGRKDYKKLFGEDAESSANLVNLETFEEVHGHS